MDKLYIVLPAYNEEKNLEPLIAAWNDETEKLKEKFNVEIIIINDGSRDDTAYIAGQLAQRKNITLINHPQNKGLGEALNTGINYVLEKKDGRYLCIMDADQTQSPSYIHDMIKKIEEERHGCIIASRYEKGAKVEGLTLTRKSLSYGARILYHCVFQIKGVKDYTCGYRLYDMNYLKQLESVHGTTIISESSFACMTELLYKLAHIGCSFGEIPFTLRYQLKQGESKMAIAHTIKRSLQMTTRLKKQVVRSVVK